jgi:hypothetical protein
VDPENNLSIARYGIGFPEDCPDKRGFTGTIGAEYRDVLAFADHDRKGIEDFFYTAKNGHILKLKQGLSGDRGSAVRSVHDRVSGNHNLQGPGCIQSPAGKQEYDPVFFFTSGFNENSISGFIIVPSRIFKIRLVIRPGG